LLDGWRSAVLLLADVLAPRRGIAFVVDLHHREVGHEAVWGSAVPVVLVRLEEYYIRAKKALAETSAPLLGNEGSFD
jgi:hypothetical protein